MVIVAVVGSIVNRDTSDVGSSGLGIIKKGGLN